VQLRVEVRLVVVVRHRIVRPSDLGERRGLVKRHFGLRGLELEAGIPRAPVGTAEARAERMGVRERRVHHRGERHGGQQFLGPDAGRAALLGQQAVVRGAIELEDRLQVRLVVRDAHEDAVSARQPARRHQAVGAGLPDEPRRREAHQPARRASSSRRTASIAGIPPRRM
jgi:hypothetical protein